jgi:hypothetical protein
VFFCSSASHILNFTNAHHCNGSGSLADGSGFGKAPDMGGDCGGTDLLENTDFPPRKAESADEEGVRVTQFQGAESMNAGIDS